MKLPEGSSVRVTALRVRYACHAESEYSRDSFDIRTAIRRFTEHSGDRLTHVGPIFGISQVCVGVPSTVAMHPVRMALGNPVDERECIRAYI